MPLLRETGAVLSLLLFPMACDGVSAASDSTTLPPPPAVDGAAPAPVTDPAGAPASTSWLRSYLGDLEIDGITSDARSDVYAAGYFVGHAAFDPEHTFDSVPGADGRPTKDIFVTKHERGSGAIAWARTFGGPGTEGNVYDLVSTSDGLIVASGAFSGTVAFDGTALTATVSAGTGSSSSGTYGNMFLAALAEDGRVRWAIQARGSALSGGNEVAPHFWGGVVQVGIFGGRAEAGGSIVLGKHDLPFSGGGFDTYVARFDANGDVLWVRPIGGDGAQRGKAIATDAQGNILVAGDAWAGTTRFADGREFRSADQDFWVAKYDPDGELLWSRNYASAGTDEVKGVGADAEGNVIVAAAFAGPTLDLRGVRVNAIPGARNTGVVFALDPAGARVRWHNTLSSVGKCCELEVDSRGFTFLGLAALGPSIRYLDGSVFSLGSPARAGLLTEVGASGAVVSSLTVHAESSELGELTLLRDRSVALTGSFDGPQATVQGMKVEGAGARTQFVLVNAPAAR